MDNIRDLALLAIVILVGCRQAPAESSERLVPGILPASTALVRENAIIVYLRGEDILNLDLQPDNRLHVIHMRGESREVVADERLEIPAEAAGRVRNMLWRVRPSNDASAENSIPLGCPPVSDTDPKMQVVFARNGPQYELEFFSLPTTHYCRTQAAADARELLDRVYRALPTSAVAAAFLRRPALTAPSR